MKFTCTQENLSQGLAVVSSIATKNANLPILNNILLRASDGGIELLATNLEIGITKRIRGKVEEAGQCTLPARILSEYIALLGQENVTIENDGTNLLVRSGNSETRLRGLPPEDFPLIPTIERTTSAVCNASALRDALSQVLFAAATDETRPEISGVYFHFSEKELTLVATDSYRLAECKLALAEPVGADTSLIVPARTLQQVSRMLGQDEAVTMYLTQNQILFVHQESELISRLIDGQFPDYRQIIPQQYSTRCTMGTADLVQAVRASSLFSRPGIHDLTFQLDAEKQQLVLRAANAQVGENWRSVDAHIEGEEQTIVFNSRYVLDGLGALGSDQTVFEMTNSANPGVFRPSTENGYLYIVMPIKQ